MKTTRYSNIRIFDPNHREISDMDRIDEELLSDWSNVLKAAAHPVPLSILSVLVRAPKCVTGLHELIGVRQPGISQHLTVLKHAGLVDSQRRGASRCYFLPRPGMIRMLFDALESDHEPADDAEVSRRITEVMTERIESLRRARKREGSGNAS